MWNITYRFTFLLSLIKTIHESQTSESKAKGQAHINLSQNRKSTQALSGDFETRTRDKTEFWNSIRNKVLAATNFSKYLVLQLKHSNAHKHLCMSTFQNLLYEMTPSRTFISYLQFRIGFFKNDVMWRGGWRFRTGDNTWKFPDGGRG